MNNQDLFKIQTCVLKVNINCEGCKHKVKNILRKIDGVYKIEADFGKVTVIGIVDPQILVEKLIKKGKRAEILVAPRPDNNLCQVPKQNKNLQIENNNGGDNKNLQIGNGGGNMKFKNVQIDNGNVGENKKGKNIQIGNGNEGGNQKFKNVQIDNGNVGENKKGKNIQIDNGNGGGNMKGKNGKKRNGKTKPNGRVEGDSNTKSNLIQNETIEDDTHDSSLFNNTNGNKLVKDIGQASEQNTLNNNGNGNGGENVSLNGNGMANGGGMKGGNGNWKNTHNIYGGNNNEYYGYPQTNFQTTQIGTISMVPYMGPGQTLAGGGYYKPQQQQMFSYESFQPMMYNQLQPVNNYMPSPYTSYNGPYAYSYPSSSNPYNIDEANA